MYANNKIFNINKFLKLIFSKKFLFLIYIN